MSCLYGTFQRLGDISNQILTVMLFFVMQNQENSKVDVISALCIDNNNKEVMSLFTSLFPGKTITELLDSQLGKMVGLALASVIGEVTGEPQGMLCMRCSFGAVA